MRSPITSPVRDNRRSAAIPDRCRTGIRAGLLATALMACGSLHGTANTKSAETQSSVAGGEPVQLLREGSRIESELAICRSSGDSLVVEIEESGRVLSVLENLSAQRLLTAVNQDPTDNRWLVAGRITEFQQQNYLFLERVTRAPTASSGNNE